MPDLLATYQNTAENASPHVFKAALPTISRDIDTDQRIAYLEELRSSIIQLQSDINVFLTGKMEEDNAKAQSKGEKLVLDDAKEEANYGEEVVEED